jgi:hypothetical protein
VRDETAGVLDLIWVKRKQEYFLGQDWTGQITLNRFKKIVFRRSRCDGRRDGRLVAPEVARADRRTERELKAMFHCPYPATRGMMEWARWNRRFRDFKAVFPSLRARRIDPYVGCLL